MNLVYVLEQETSSLLQSFRARPWFWQCRDTHNLPDDSSDDEDDDEMDDDEDDDDYDEVSGKQLQMFL